MRVKVQKTPTGKLLGACIALGAEIMEPYKDEDYIEMNPVIIDGNLAIYTTKEPSIPITLINPILEALICKQTN